MKKGKIIIAALLLIAIVLMGLNLLKPNTSPIEQDSLKSQIAKLEESYRFLEKDFDKLGNENKELLQKMAELDRERISQLSEVTGLINLQEVDDSIVIDLRYATENNFVGKKVYPAAVCLLQKDTTMKLKAANELAKKDGYRIKIWDGYRPLDVQKIFWDAVPDPRYVSNPSKGTDHNRGTAVDVTLVDESGNELEMPTDFDEFTEKAWRNYQGNSPHAQKNMEYLTRIMEESGFTTIRTEWWHFRDSNDQKYPFQNVKLEYFVPSEF